MMRLARHLLVESLPLRARHWPLWLVTTLLFVVSVVVAPRATAGGEGAKPRNVSFSQLVTLESAFQSVVERVTPSVVGIRAERRHVTTVRGLDDGERNAIEQHVIVNGSGTIISPDGLILTNEHVIQSADPIEVMFNDGQKVTATVLASDPRSDLAILHVPRQGLTPARICDWNAIARGQWIVVLGNPFGLGNDGQLSVSVGVIANLGRQLPGLGEVDDRFYNDMIQVTAPINPGNSGGPLFNIQGELVGVVTAMHTRAPADEGIGFAIPMTPIKRRVINTLSQGQEMHYGYLGLTVRVPTDGERATLDSRGGVVVKRVEPGGPAEAAGITVGDIVLRYESQPVTGPAQFAELAGQSPVGAQVCIDVVHEGAAARRHATVANRDVSRVGWMRGDAFTWRGIRIADLDEDVRRRMYIGNDVQHGVVVTSVAPGSPAAAADLHVGDVIASVGNQSVRDALAFMRRVRDVKGSLTVTLDDGKTRRVTARD
jgi:serine protease Do